ncbi:MAG: cytochrome c-type biogenesis protein CcmH [Chloroflexi bacterium]|nr:cytochrome c-type biogenesis protein CcmH [Chloroflexota bacterium]
MSKNFLHKAQNTLLIAALLALFGTLTVSAQGPAPTDDEVNAIAKQLFCPVCESTPLDVCPTEACRQWRELIREMLADGKSEAEIKQYFVEHFGAQVLNEPPNKFASYAVPVAAFLIGAFLLFRGFQMWLKPVKADTALEGGSGLPESEAKPIPQDDYIARLEEEVKKQK